MLEIYDCTLRDGEQAAGASFSLVRRLDLFSLLDSFGIDYIEVGWPIASPEIMQSFALCRKKRKNSKIVAFGSTSINEDLEKDNNLKSLVESKADYACIFGKSHLDHVEKQLKTNPEENLKRIKSSIEFLLPYFQGVFYDAEHFFDGYKLNKNYVLETLVSAIKGGAERIILCDTNGGTLPSELEKIIKETKLELEKRNYKANLGIHPHNDCGLAIANSLIALPYIVQVQGTINGIGERVGNLNLTEFLSVYVNKMGNKLNVDLRKLKEINEKAFILSGVSGAQAYESRPFVGDNAFAHKGGVHIDATSKGASYEHAKPESFGNKRVIVLNTLGGRSGIVSVAKDLGYNLNKNDISVMEKVEELYKELKDLEIKGYRIGSLKPEHFLLIEKYFRNLKEFLTIDYWNVNIEAGGDEEKSQFYFLGKLNGDVIEKTEEVKGGPIDAAYKAIRNSLSFKYPKINDLKLIDYEVGIAIQMREESTVRTLVRFSDGEEFETVGVDKNIIASGLEAIVKGFRYYLNRNYK